MLSRKSFGTVPVLGLLVPGLALVLVLVSVAGCVPSRMHRPQSVIETGDYTQIFIEFDDQGELWSPDQLDRALRVLESASMHPGGALVNVFVHGWNHDASLANEASETGNVRGQQTLLEQVVESERITHPDRPRPVVGIYIGWRGRILEGPLNFASFFNRRRAANRVAGITATGTVYRLLSAAKTNPSSRVVLLGHSFGGLVVERTLSQALVGSLFAPGADRRSSFDFPADLVILVNPASPAIHAKQFVEMLERYGLALYREDRSGIRREMPAVVSITSEGDWATGLFYPAGLRMLALGKSYRDYGEDYCGANDTQRSFAIRTAGHHEVLHSHVVTEEPLSSSEKPTAGYGGQRDRPARWEFDPLTGQPVIVFDGSEHRYRIKRKPRAFNDTPYWIMQVPRSLIPDHSRVFRFDFFRMVSALMVATGAIDASTTTRLVREDGIRPIGMAPDGQGGLIFLDRSRRMYRIPEHGAAPVFFGCLPPELDPRDGLGFGYENGEYITGIRRREGRGSDEWSTHFHVVRVEPERVVPLARITAKSKERFEAMTADVSGRRVFLAHERGEIWAADLSLSRPEVKLLAEIEGGGRSVLLQYQDDRDALFIADADGAIHHLDLRTGEDRILIGGLGRLTALEYDPWRHRLYVADSLNKRIWRFDCATEPCQGPISHVSCPQLERPAALRAMENGDVWIGDSQKEALAVARVDDGEITYTYTSVRQPPVRGKGLDR